MIVLLAYIVAVMFFAVVCGFAACMLCGVLYVCMQRVAKVFGHEL